MTTGVRLQVLAPWRSSPLTGVVRTEKMARGVPFFPVWGSNRACFFGVPLGLTAHVSCELLPATSETSERPQAVAGA